MARTRREFTKEFKLSVLREVEAGASVAETARAHEIHPETIRLWKRNHRKYADRAFAGKGRSYTDEAKIAQMERAMGQLALENALLKKAIKFLEDWRRDNAGKR